MLRTLPRPGLHAASRGTTTPSDLKIPLQSRSRSSSPAGHTGRPRKVKRGRSSGRSSTRSSGDELAPGANPLPIRADVPVHARAAAVAPAAAPVEPPAVPLLLPASASPVPEHVWPPGMNHSVFQLPSYKRQRGPLHTQGPPIRVLALPVIGKDGNTTW